MTFMNQNMRNKSCQCKCSTVKNDNRRAKKAIPSKIKEVLRVQTLCRETLFCENASKGSERNEGAVNFFTVRAVYL
jgi:hypothetical protein